MEFLQLEEIQAKSGEIFAALDALLSTRAVVARRVARQWQFLQDSLQRLVSPGFISGFDEMAPVKVAQYKFELEDRLRRFYFHPGKPLDYVFSVVHRSKLPNYAGIDETSYPDLVGYCLLIRDVASDRNVTNSQNGEDLKLYLERVIGEANDSEFRAYAALPEIRTDEIERWFCTGSPALNEILNLLNRHRQKRWIISNPFNPSTKRLLNTKVKKVSQDEAIVNTTEYWYLRWWDDRDGSYAFSYRETNRQMYVVKKEGSQWKVFQNLRSLPRTSTPNRWHRRQK